MDPDTPYGVRLPRFVSHVEGEVLPGRDHHAQRVEVPLLQDAGEAGRKPFRHRCALRIRREIERGTRPEAGLGVREAGRTHRAGQGRPDGEPGERELIYGFLPVRLEQGNGIHVDGLPSPSPHQRAVGVVPRSDPGN